jgi:hypothetical protein
MSTLDKALCRRVAVVSRRHKLRHERKLQIRQLLRVAVRHGHEKPRA